MKFLKRILTIISRKRLHKFSTRLSKYIFYRIVEVDSTLEKYTLQCVNTRTVFSANLSDIISDKNIIYRLHPIQSCYVGIEYARKLNEKKSILTPVYPAASDPLATLPGIYRLCYQDRKNNLCFVNDQTKEELIMDPRDIVLSEALMEGFNTVQAFHIGFLAGLKLHDAKEGNRCQAHERLRRPHLWLVK